MNGTQRRTLALVGGLLLLTATAPAEARVKTALNLGADYWLADQGVFHATVSLGAALSRNFVLGGRFGALVSTAPIVGLPIDAQLRIIVESFYADILVGPWVLFVPYPFRIHAAAGFGYQSKIFSIGVEAGWLHPAATIGLRIGFHFT